MEAVKLFAKWNKTPLDKEILGALGIYEFAKKQYYQLSTGQKRRLHLALALTRNPDILFLDEPTAGLDVEGRLSLHEQIRQLKAMGKTIILASHDMAEVENLCDRISILSGGELLLLELSNNLTKWWESIITSQLITCYIVPLLFFAIMGGIFTSVMPETRYTLIQSMTVFGVTMGALIGLPPSLVEIYSSDIKKVYKANGMPLYLGLVLTNISAYIHLFIMSVIIYIAAPLAFNAEIPENPVLYFVSLAIFIAVSLSIASIVGLAVKDQAKTSMVSIIVFLPSIMLSGIMFPIELLPKVFETVGKIFPASWGYRLMADSTLQFENLFPLIIILILAICVCGILLRKIEKQQTQPEQSTVKMNALFARRPQPRPVLQLGSQGATA